MAQKNKLSIYLIKSEYKDDDSILKSGKKLLADLQNTGRVYYNPSHMSVPPWVNSFFRGQLGTPEIFTANARAVLLTEVSVAKDVSRIFAITMGYGKYMLEDDVIEEDFGLRVVLNTITPNSLRRINKINIGGNQKTSNEQLPLESDIDDFGFDIDRDLIGAVTGCSDDENFTTGIMTGSDLLSLTAEVDINNLVGFLKLAYGQYTSKEYEKYFPWIDHIRRVKDSRLIEALDAQIINMINEGSPKVWMAVPEVIDWENVGGFKYAGRTIYDDIHIETVCGSFKNGLVHIDQLKGKRITAVRAENTDELYDSWQAYKCIFGEVDIDGKAYSINNGRWYSVDVDFVKQIDADYKSIPVSDMVFLPHKKEFVKESQYTQAFVDSDNNHLLLMDANVIGHGGGKSKVELCDVLTVDNTYIHIKPYSGSATLSHLFNQAVVSAELVMGDREFVAKANMKIKESTLNDAFLIEGQARPNVIIAIISKHNCDRPPIPFFSKVALRYARRRLETYGCQVSIKNIVRE